MSKTGRPSSYTAEIGERVCASIASGLSVAATCAPKDMPGERTIFQWLASPDPICAPFAHQYARARQIRADARFERIDNVITDMREGRIDAAVARVEIDAIKWQAGKEQPKRYGERLELAGDPDNPLQLSVADVLRQRRAQRAQVSPAAPLGLPEPDANQE